jgi:hypothetical protein
MLRRVEFVRSVVSEEHSTSIIRVTESVNWKQRTLAVSSNWRTLPDDGGATFLRNVVSYKSDTAKHPRRRHSPKSSQFSLLFNNELCCNPADKRNIAISCRWNIINAKQRTSANFTIACKGSYSSVPTIQNFSQSVHLSVFRSIICLCSPPTLPAIHLVFCLQLELQLCFFINPFICFLKARISLFRYFFFFPIRLLSLKTRCYSDFVARGRSLRNGNACCHTRVLPGLLVNGNHPTWWKGELKCVMLFAVWRTLTVHTSRCWWECLRCTTIPACF